MGKPEERLISFVVPVKDEQDTIGLLFEKIRDVFAKEKLGHFEIIFIDDGSRDASWDRMASLAQKHAGQVKALRFRRNFGKAAALSVGFSHAAGDMVITMDADLQDDPGEVPRFLAKLDDGFDLVSGWKQRRQDPLGKTLPSRLFNAVVRALSGVTLHDFNCGFKAYRRPVLRAIKLYGELHRFIPVLADQQGFRVTEIPVQHHPRKFGQSKYGWERLGRGFLDLLTVITITRYMRRPGHLFGGVGLVFGLAGFAILSYLSTLWFLGLGPIGTRPLLSFGIMLLLMGVQFVSLGLLAELITRNAPAVEGENTQVSDKEGC